MKFCMNVIQKATKEKIAVFCILAFMKEQIYIARIFSKYSITLQIYYVYPISNVPKLPESKYVSLSIQTVTSKYICFKLKKENICAEIKRVELARIHTTSKVLLEKPYVNAI